MSEKKVLWVKNGIDVVFYLKDDIYNFICYDKNNKKRF